MRKTCILRQPKEKKLSQNLGKVLKYPGRLLKYRIRFLDILKERSIKTSKKVEKKTLSCLEKEKITKIPLLALDSRTLRELWEK